MINFKSAKKIYFIGIGGIGISAVARMMLAEGKEVSGSDQDETLITRELKKKGICIFIGQKEEHITPDIDAVIYTIAAGSDNPELKKARSLHIQTISYPEMLGMISRDKFTIAISGTHGKTTTTAMIGKILKDAGLDPTIIVGSLLKDGGTNFMAGESEYFVVEACEYKRSFLHLEPNILVITNIDNDHLDYYKDMNDIESAFRKLAEKVGTDGYIIANLRDVGVARALKDVHGRIIDYAKKDKGALALKVPGEHNISNAKAARAVADILKISPETAHASLAGFTGTWRRFEYKGKTAQDVLVYDDYAHHPTEIRATLRAARESFPSKKLIVIFQPHLYSRTRLLLNEFAKSFSDADEVIIAPIYAARENDDKSINSQILAEKIKEHNKNTCSFDNFDSIVQYVQKRAKTGDVIITCGAGDIYKVGDILTH